MMSTPVQLRDVIETDLPVFFEHQLDLEASRMAAYPSRGGVAFNAHWTRLLSNDSIQIQTILFNKKVAGNIVCFEQLGQREVGYWLGREFWGKGIATQALTEFLKQIPTRPLRARVAKHNIASRRVLEKCGFVVSGEDRFFSQILGREIEEYVLVLNTNKDSD